MKGTMRRRAFAAAIGVAAILYAGGAHALACGINTKSEFYLAFLAGLESSIVFTADATSQERRIINFTPTPNYPEGSAEVCKTKYAELAWWKGGPNDFLASFYGDRSGPSHALMKHCKNQSVGVNNIQREERLVVVAGDKEMNTGKFGMAGSMPVAVDVVYDGSEFEVRAPLCGKTIWVGDSALVVLAGAAVSAWGWLVAMLLMFGAAAQHWWTRRLVKASRM